MNKTILMQVEETDGTMRLVLNEMTEVQRRALSNLIKDVATQIDIENKVKLEEM